MYSFLGICQAIRAANVSPQGALPLHAPVFYGNERAYVLDAIDSTFVSSVGQYVQRFEEMLCHMTGARYAVACVNGTSALHMALHVAGVKKDDLVLMQTLSFVATANAIVHCGAEPVFLDVDEDTLGLSAKAVGTFLRQHAVLVKGACFCKASGRRIAACVPMHTYGLPCRMAELMALCHEWGIPLVEDAAEALGSLYQGQHCGTLGAMGALSFNGNKIATTGGGGAILTNDEALAHHAKHLTTTAKVPHAWAFCHDAVAWNYRMPNLNAALGCAQLEQVEAFVAEKRQRALVYAEIFSQSQWRFVQELEGNRSNYWLCTVLANSASERDAFLKAAHAEGIQARPAWELLHRLPMYTQCTCDSLINSQYLADRIINIPSGVQHQ